MGKNQSNNKLEGFGKVDITVDTDGDLVEVVHGTVSRHSKARCSSCGQLVKPHSPDVGASVWCTACSDIRREFRESHNDARIEQLRLVVDSDAAAMRSRAMNLPRKYNVRDQAEIVRLCRECRGYIREDDGTDFKGRAYARSALSALALVTEEKDQRIAELEQAIKNYLRSLEEIE